MILAVETNRAIAALVRDIADHGKLREAALKAALAMVAPGDRPRLKALTSRALLDLALRIWVNQGGTKATQLLRATIVPFLLQRRDILAQIEQLRGRL